MTFTPWHLSIIVASLQAAKLNYEYSSKRTLRNQGEKSTAITLGRSSRLNTRMTSFACHVTQPSESATYVVKLSGTRTTIRGAAKVHSSHGKNELSGPVFLEVHQKKPNNLSKEIIPLRDRLSITEIRSMKGTRCIKEEERESAKPERSCCQLFKIDRYNHSSNQSFSCVPD